MRKCATISPYMRRPSVIYDFATAPFWISLYCMWGKFYFLFDQCTVQKQASEQYTAPIKFSLDNLTFALRKIGSSTLYIVRKMSSVFVTTTTFKTVTPMPRNLLHAVWSFSSVKGSKRNSERSAEYFFSFGNWQPYYKAIAGVNGN